MPSGLEIEEVVEGTGAVAEPGCAVTIRWRGKPRRGDEFGAGTQSFRLGDRSVIAGLGLGVQGMRVGGKRRLRISPHLGYGDRAVPGVPPNAVLLIEVELLSVD
ncbi:MAG: FKBP-type peptidyl-prolyl cis-trans isomerase [Gemmataceae bacterium]|nr:FKBP-type peptidyl-prolyl cis-trans isomerase [Gemmataceae bacterium]